jgi:tRNA-binding EMAP/Myf-like protein
MLGAPVDEIVDLGGELGDVLIARVDEVRPHPNADRLRVCTVTAAEGAEPLPVVCGAPNVEAGRFYPFAPVGATLPGGVQIKKAKLRGEESQGMLCLGARAGAGTRPLGADDAGRRVQPGTRFREALGLDDFRLVVDVTPNRGELLSHVGIARELAPGGVDGIELPALPRRAQGDASPAPRGGARATAAPPRGDRGRGRLPALHGRHRPRREGGAIARVAGHAAARGGAAPHQQRGRRHQLRAAGAGAAAARLRPTAGCAAARCVIRRAAPGETLRTLDGVERACWSPPTW